MIDLGLKRISQLVPNASALPWRAIHVAGTNGKGSVCAYLTSVLHASSIPVGRFTSPHLVYPHDSITINNAPIPTHLYQRASAIVQQRNSSLSLNATEFELLTATAFECFTLANVEIGVVEVGLGGRLDATNILTGKIACVVTKVDLDHQGFLGNTLGEIAREKAGIATELGVPVVVDGGNHREVVEAVEKVANEASARVVIPQVKVLGSEEGGSAVEITTEAFGKQKFLKMLPGRFQAGNLACAVTALSETVKKGYSSITAESVLHGVAATEWPGRLQTVSVEQITGVPESTVLLDGAHNPGAAKELRNFVGEQESIVWVLAFSRGKDVSEMVGILMKAGDEVVATRFGEVEDMPWVKPVDPDEIVEAVKQKHGVDGNTAGNVTDGVKKSFSLASGRKVVVAGSLYMVGELLRELN